MTIKKVDKLIEETVNKQNIRREQKIWLWLFLFPPIGVYKAIKFKAFDKKINIALIIFMIIGFILALDTMFYPNRVIDYKVEKAIESYTEDIGELRSYVKQGTLDDKFFIYSMITTKGEYDVYFSGDGKLNIQYIYQLTPERKVIYKSENIPKGLDYIYPEIIRFFNNEDIIEKLGFIKDYETSDLDNSQIIITDKGKFLIKVEYGQVVDVFEFTDNNSYEKIIHINPEIKLPHNIEKTLSHNKKIVGNIKEVYGYKVNENIIEYYFLNEENKHFKIVQYLDGSMQIFIQN